MYSGFAWPLLVWSAGPYVRLCVVMSYSSLGCSTGLDGIINNDAFQRPFEQH